MAHCFQWAMIVDIPLLASRTVEELREAIIRLLDEEAPIGVDYKIETKIRPGLLGDTTITIWFEHMSRAGL